MARPAAKKALAEAKSAMARGDAGSAALLLEEAHRTAPQDAGVAGLLADAHMAQTRFMEAIEVLANHLEANPRNTEAAQTLSDLFSAVTPVTFGTVSASGLAAALSLDRVTPEPLARAAGLLLMERGGLATATGDGALSSLLEAALKAAPVTEPGLEAQLVAHRKACLLGGGSEVSDSLLAAVAHQAWHNEYVWPVSDEERVAVANLSSGAGSSVGLRALYQPPDIGEASATAGPLEELTGIISREAHDMARAESSLGPALTPTDETGKAVAAQYEDNPYPRWLWIQAPPAGAARRQLTAMTPDAPEDLKGGWEKGQLRILVAGCGTGQQAVQAAQAYAPRADLLGFDFSRASLRYAAMKARQHRAGNIRFRQADILALPDFEAPFDRPVDLIECVGVLHHLADPFAGWRALLERLKPGGLMYLGLYSATARGALTAYREGLAAQGADGSDADAIRDVRARILSAPASAFEQSLGLSADFYSLSNVRDLLFHAHEMPVTLDQIEDFLDEVEIDFLQMDVRPHIADAMAAEEGRGALDDFKAWKRFEAAHPDAFEGMYLFWVQKPV